MRLLLARRAVEAAHRRGQRCARRIDAASSSWGGGGGRMRVLVLGKQCAAGVCMQTPHAARLRSVWSRRAEKLPPVLHRARAARARGVA